MIVGENEAAYSAATNTIDMSFHDAIIDLFQAFKGVSCSISDSFYSEDASKGHFLFRFDKPVAVGNRKESKNDRKHINFLSESEMSTIFGSCKWKKHPIPISPSVETEVCSYCKYFILGCQ